MSMMRLGRRSRASACAFLIAGLAWVVSLHAATPTLFSPDEFWTWAEGKAKSSPRLEALLKELEEAYEVVFVPGILGSKLTIDGRYVYGEHAIDSSKLAYRPGQQVVAEALESFRVGLAGFTFARKDIYGEALDGLSVAISTGRPVHVFPYDWRQDIDRSAAELNQFLTSRHAGKRVLLIAHSMGGLVAWRWKQKHYSADSPVHLFGMMLAGSPLQGTCEAVRMIAGGYGAPEDSPAWESAALSMVFRDSHAAVLTFPSVFQLLPKFTPSSPCVKIVHAGSQYPKDHHAPLTWLKRHGTSGIEATAQERLKTFARDARIPPAEYARLVLAAIAAGKRFRAEFSPDHNGGNLALLYSEARSLAPFHLFTQEEAWLAPYRTRDTAAGFHPGDGRVLAESAKNGVSSERNRRQLSAGARFARLQKEHGDLINDPELHAFVRDHLPLWIEQDKIATIRDFARSVPELRSEMQSRGWIGRPSAYAFANDAKTQDRARRLAQDNLQAALGSASNVHSATLAYVESVLKVNSWSAASRNDAVALALLESAVILEPGPSSTNTLTLLGTILARQQRHVEAVVALETASYWDSKETNWVFGETRSTKIYSALARSYDKIGEKNASQIAANFSDPVFRAGPWYGDNRANNPKNFVWQPFDRRQYERLVGDRQDGPI